MVLIPRQGLRDQVDGSIEKGPVTALLGPRQCGKTTLARQISGSRPGTTFFDLENPRDLVRLENPQLVLEPLQGLIVIDEAQRLPGLWPLLRVLADRRPLPARFLLLGSASPLIVQGVSESLAGRIRLIEMSGLTLPEVGANQLEPLWMRGGFPPSFLAGSDEESWTWRENFVRTFLERDIPQLGIRIPAIALRRFWTMVAHSHGQIWNARDIASSLGIAHTTARRYLDLLSGAFVMRQLPAWFTNTGKRLVKSPKAYIRDSGLLHSLLGIPTLEALQSHPRLGSSWEGFAIEQILAHLGDRDAYFWATHGGAELDLLIVRGTLRWGFELKYSDAPRMTRSLHSALEDLHPEKIWVVHPGDQTYPLHERIECTGLRRMSQILDEIRQ